MPVLNNFVPKRIFGAWNKGFLCIFPAFVQKLCNIISSVVIWFWLYYQRKCENACLTTPDLVNKIPHNCGFKQMSFDSLWGTKVFISSYYQRFNVWNSICTCNILQSIFHSKVKNILSQTQGPGLSDILHFHVHHMSN